MALKVPKPVESRFANLTRTRCWLANPMHSTLAGNPPSGKKPQTLRQIWFGKPHLRLQLCRALRGGAALERGRSSSSSRRCGRSIVRRCFEAAGLSFLGVLCPKSMKDETCHSYNSSLIDLRSQRNQHRERLAQSSGKPSSMFSFIKVHSA